VAQAPALRLERRQRVLDGVLRLGPDPAPTSEREPVARAQAERSGNDEAIGDETRTHAGSPQAKERGDDRPDPRFAGAREPAVLLAPRTVDPVCPDDRRSSSSALARAAASRSHVGCCRAPRTTAWRIASRAVEPCRQSRCPSRRASHSQFHAIGKDPTYVMQQLGHTDPAFTLRVYAHAMRRSEEERARLKALVEGHDWSYVGHKTAETASAPLECHAD
jgi:hypothetical protein